MRAKKYHISRTILLYFAVGLAKIAQKPHILCRKYNIFLLLFPSLFASFRQNSLFPCVFPQF